MSRRVQLKTKETVRITPDVTIEVYDGHLIIVTAGHEAPFYGERLTKLEAACRKARGATAPESEGRNE